MGRLKMNEKQKAFCREIYAAGLIWENIHPEIVEEYLDKYPFVLMEDLISDD
jgi:hypothetical protein